MGKVAVVTDSAACLPLELIRKYNIHVVPFALIFGEQVYQDGVDVTTTQFYHMLREASEFPTTSQPSVGEFLAVYQALREKAGGVVSIHVPATISGTFSSARMAAGLIPELPVRVVDSGSAAMAQGFVVLAAARAAAAGMDLEGVVQAARVIISSVHLYATLGTLEYLARSGRVPGVVALAGSALHIHPVFTIRQGQVEVVGRVRTKKRAVAHMLERMAADVGDRPVHAAVFHADVPEEVEKLRQQVGDRFHCVELHLTEFTPVMGAHTGPEVLGLAFYAEEV